MISAQTDMNTLIKMKTMNLDAIIEWFEHRISKYYCLGQIYVNDDKVEEVFYQCIMSIHTEYRKKRDHIPFEKWVTSVFIQTCKEISRSNPRTEASNNIIDSLETIHKEAIILMYDFNYTENEIAEILECTLKIIKNCLLTGFRQLSGCIEVSGEGCNVHRDHFIDYLHRNLHRKDKIELEVHLHSCQHCQLELAAIQNQMQLLTNEFERLEIPANIMLNVKNRIDKAEQAKQMLKKKRTKIGIITGTIFILFVSIGLFTNTFSNMYYAWVDWRANEDEQLRLYYKSGLGERLNMEVVSNGIKVKIKSAIADEFQTIVYYEIENMNNDKKYTINAFDGDYLSIENEHEIIDHGGNPHFTYGIGADMQLDEKNLSKGKFSLLPIKEDSGTIELKISRLQEVTQEENVILPYEHMEFFDGDWSFKIPVTKQPSVVHELDLVTEIEGIPIEFESLIHAPTVTMLQFKYKYFHEDKDVYGVNFTGLETKDKTYLPDKYGWTGQYNHYNDWLSAQVAFDPLYFEDPKVINPQFGSINLYVREQKSFNIDPNGDFPQIIEYLGSNLSVDRVTIGSPTKVSLTAELSDKRVFDDFQVTFETNEKQQINTIFSEMDGVLLDKNGKEYSQEDYFAIMNTFERPRFFRTKLELELYNDIDPGAEIIPAKMIIEGYGMTKYTDEEVELHIK